MSNHKLTDIEQHEIEVRRRSTLYLLGLVVVVVVLISFLVTVLH